MELFFDDRNLERACMMEGESIQAWGEKRAAVVRRRIAQLSAAEHLAVLTTLPPLQFSPGDRPGEFTIDVLHPYRLSLAPWLDPLPRSRDGGLALAQVTTIRILAIKEQRGH
jgi:plasmid maintenance system killer protein